MLSVPFNKDQVLQDFLASLVVFLVAMPLCLGIALACGLSPTLGLVSGVIGGLVVATFSGCQLQVSGPAAGLITLVYDLVQQHGYETFGLVVLLSGIIQILFGVLKLGKWFRAVSTAVIQGMLAGIGILIFSSQFHVMIDDAPRHNAIENILSIPTAIYKALTPYSGFDHNMAAAIGMLTIGVIILWNLAPAKIKQLPAPLVGVLLAMLVADLFNLPIQYIEVPENILNDLHFLHLNPPGELLGMLSPEVFISAVTFAFVASAETLLTCTAVDHMHQGARTNYSKEMLAQGLGNSVAGLIGAIPITGVIVRSAANVQAGAKTRLSAILHGVWILAFVTLFTWALKLIPTACLAAILVYTGYKLVKIKEALKLLRFGKMELVIYIATVVGIVTTHLLEGILIGFALSLANLLYALARLTITYEETEPHIFIGLEGHASFVALPQITELMDNLPPGRHVILSLKQVKYIDSACLECLMDWQEAYISNGGTVHIESNDTIHQMAILPTPTPELAPIQK